MYQILISKLWTGLLEGRDGVIVSRKGGLTKVWVSVVFECLC